MSPSAARWPSRVPSAFPSGLHSSASLHAPRPSAWTRTPLSRYLRSLRPHSSFPFIEVEWRTLLVEIGGLFEGGGNSEQQTFLKVIRHDLQTNGQSHRVETTRDGDGWESSIADRHRELPHASIAFRIDSKRRCDERMRRCDESVHFLEDLSNFGNFTRSSGNRCCIGVLGNLLSLRDIRLGYWSEKVPIRLSTICITQNLIEFVQQDGKRITEVDLTAQEGNGHGLNLCAQVCQRVERGLDRLCHFRVDAPERKVFDDPQTQSPHAALQLDGEVCVGCGDGKGVLGIVTSDGGQERSGISNRMCERPDRVEAVGARKCATHADAAIGGAHPD